LHSQKRGKDGKTLKFVKGFSIEKVEKRIIILFEISFAE